MVHSYNLDLRNRGRRFTPSLRPDWFQLAWEPFIRTEKKNQLKTKLYIHVYHNMVLYKQKTKISNYSKGMNAVIKGVLYAPN